MSSSLIAPLSVGAADSTISTRWDAFVEEANPGDLCHRYSWKAVFESTYDLHCEYLVAEQHANIVGVLPLVVVNGLFSGKRLVSLPFLDQGGVMARDTDVAAELFSAATELAGNVGVQGIDLRGGLMVGEGDDAGASHRFRFLLDLPDDSEQLWSKIGGKVRNQVRKSEKSGLVTDREDSDGLETFYRIFAENMKRLGSPVHSRRLFSAILREFGEQARIYITRDASGLAVAGGVAIRSGATTTVPWASSVREARASCPNHSLYWRILRDSVDEAGSVFDFGRSSEGTGTFRFKKQWNARPAPLSWNSWDSGGQAQATEHLDPRRNQRLAQTWSRLPLPVANTLGPLVRKRLSH